MSLVAPNPSPYTLGAVEVFVRGLTVEAEIGVYDHEHGRTQPLVIDVSLETTVVGAETLGETVNYEVVARTARALVEAGHVVLVETFAERLARRLLDEDPRIVSARVRIEKPLALAPATAGVEIRLTRAGAPAQYSPNRPFTVSSSLAGS